MATHRIRCGYFTQRENLELLALPVVGPEGVHEPIQVTLLSKPDDPTSAGSWEGRVVDDSSFRIIHGVLVDRLDPDSDLDSVLLASEEGLTWFYNGTDGGWHRSNLASGEQGQVQTTGFKGTGNVAIGGIGGDAYAYIATVEPFHGNTVAVYTKEPGASLADVVWKRTVLDVYGDPNDVGEGPGHHVVAADFDGDGDDEFLVALRGPMPWQGVFYYKAIDLQKGLFVKTRVSSASAARIAVADFDGDGRLDFATTGYYTPGYFLADNPQILVFLNRFADVSAGENLVAPYATPQVPGYRPLRGTTTRTRTKGARAVSTEEKKSLEDNKAIVRRAYLDGMNTRDMGIIEEVFSPEYVSHFPGQPPTRGR